MTDFAPASASLSSADLHLASILTSPLFGKPVQSPTSSNTTVSQLKEKTKHPIEIFEESVSHGQATIDIARLCLNAFRLSLQDLPKSEKKSQLCHMAAGTRVLKWLWTSGKIHAYAFAEDRRFTDVLSYFLLQEANVSALWDLILLAQQATRSQESSTLSKDIHRRKGLMLLSLVKAHLSISPSPDAALDAFLQAAEGSKSSTSNISNMSLVQAGALLTRQLTHVDANRHLQPPSALLYDRFVQSCPLWDKNSSDRALYRVAALKLHHPVSPSARDALYFIRHLKQSPAHPFLSPSTDAQKADVFNFFFETVHLLQRQGFHDDSVWVMEFMKHAFPQHLAEQKNDSVAPQPNALSSSDEAANEPVLLSWRMPDLG